jgi:hypothetical protein
MEKGNEQIHDERLQEQIAKAQATAPREEELEIALNEEAELNNLFLQGKINGEELKKTVRAKEPTEQLMPSASQEKRERLLACSENESASVARSAPQWSADGDAASDLAGRV